ncbi:MAG: phosphoglycolate phosphatase [Robiginitomaculum sp.]|nr:phosphoglycolate phosphatase [Robiginitomaculum sp.]
MPISIVFDLDGTLVDSAPDLHYCTNVLMDEMGLPPLDLPTVTGFIGHGIGPLVESALQKNNAGQSGAKLAKIIARFSDIYAADPAKFCLPYDGVLDTLKTLKGNGHKLAICTNKAYRLARLVVDAIGLDKYCPVLIGGDSLPLRKPDPAPLYECVDLLGDNFCLYVGDSETDAGTAQNAQCPFFLHTKGYRKTPVRDLYHTTSFSNWDAFLPLLKKLNL